MVCSDSRALLGCSDDLGEYFFIILIKLEAIAEYPSTCTENRQEWDIHFLSTPIYGGT